MANQKTDQKDLVPIDPSIQEAIDNAVAEALQQQGKKSQEAIDNAVAEALKNNKSSEISTSTQDSLSKENIAKVKALVEAQTKSKGRYEITCDSSVDGKIQRTSFICDEKTAKVYLSKMQGHNNPGIISIDKILTDVVTKEKVA